MSRELTAADIHYLRSIPESVAAMGMHGLEDIVRLLVVALIAEGHVLLEGNPGLGKTALVKALSKALGLGDKSVGRIQFTPDLMPADITGSLMPDEDGSGRLTFRKGPIFHELLLADEINRATPKTQAAMLEAMAEFQVTVLGKSEALRKIEIGTDGLPTPFMVMATQNPIDQDGTFDLPEAQLDRFLFKVRMALPGAKVIGDILDKELEISSGTSAGFGALPERKGALANLDRARRAAMAVRLPPSVRAHIVNIIQASNGAMSEVHGVSAKRMARLEDTVSQVEYPFGPRAATALAKAVLGWSACVLTDPAAANESGAHTRRALAQVVVPGLRHRVRFRHTYGGDDGSEADKTDQLLRELASAAAPDQRLGGDLDGYNARFDEELEAARSLRV